MKQMLVVRKDLKMRKGKIAAQCAHASMKILLDRIVDVDEETLIELGIEHIETLNVSDIDREWLFGSFKKICVSVDSEDELLAAVKKAELANLPVALITDNGDTEFHGVKTNTCAAIGPASDEELEPITGGLKLL